MIKDKLFKDFLSLGFLEYMLSNDATPENINYVQVLEIEPLFKSLSLSKNIKFSPQISKKIDTPQITVNITDKTEPDNSPEQQIFASETIAWIYERQGALSQAINIYKRLIELEPEKSDYYVKKINELEKALNS